MGILLWVLLFPLAIILIVGVWAWFYIKVKIRSARDRKSRRENVIEGEFVDEETDLGAKRMEAGFAEDEE